MHVLSYFVTEKKLNMIQKREHGPFPSKLSILCYRKEIEHGSEV